MNLPRTYTLEGTQCHAISFEPEPVRSASSDFHEAVSFQTGFRLPINTSRRGKKFGFMLWLEGDRFSNIISNQCCLYEWEWAEVPWCSCPSVMEIWYRSQHPHRCHIHHPYLIHHVLRRVSVALVTDEANTRTHESNRPRSDRCTRVCTSS
jgi:hypothetical protein